MNKIPPKSMSCKLWYAFNNCKSASTLQRADSDISQFLADSTGSTATSMRYVKIQVLSAYWYISQGDVLQEFNHSMRVINHQRAISRQGREVHLQMVSDSSLVSLYCVSTWNPCSFSWIKGLKLASLVPFKPLAFFSWHFLYHVFYSS